MWPARSKRCACARSWSFCSAWLLTLPRRNTAGSSPATPYQAGVDLAKQLDAVLVTYRGTQHGVVLSGQLSQEVRRKCLALRADAVFDKASEMDDFLAYCRALVGPPVGGPAAMPRMP